MRPSSTSGIDRVIWIVLDSVGVGELPDAPDYGDQGSDTLGNISRAVPLRLPTLRALGLPRVARIQGMADIDRPALWLWSVLGNARVSAGDSGDHARRIESDLDLDFASRRAIVSRDAIGHQN